MTISGKSPEGLTSEVQDYFLVVRGSVEGSELSEPARKIEELLEPYDAALLLSANVWRDRPEQLSRIDYTFLIRMVNHLQFIAASDPHSIWGVEMRLKEPRQGFHLWMPALATFVRMDSSMADLLKDSWISSVEFLHPIPRNSSAYDRKRLKGGISFVANITTDNNGRIIGLTALSQEETAHTVLEASFTRRGDPAFVPSTQATVALQTARVILGNLPIDTIEYRGRT